jgi:hypothetical protein
MSAITAVRFMDGDESAAADVKRSLSNAIFRLLQAGARSVVAAHHAPKSFEQETYISAENVLRGSGELAAVPATVWGIKQVSRERNLIYVANAKPRDFEPPPPFLIEGRPAIDETGDFRLEAAPGLAPALADLMPRKPHVGRPKDEERQRRVALVKDWLTQEHGMSVERIVEKFAADGVKVAPDTARTYRREAKFSGGSGGNRPEVTIERNFSRRNSSSIEEDAR